MVQWVVALSTRIFNFFALEFSSKMIKVRIRPVCFRRSKVSKFMQYLLHSFNMVLDSRENLKPRGKISFSITLVGLIGGFLI